MVSEWNESIDSEVYVLARKVTSNIGGVSEIGFMSRSAETCAVSAVQLP